MAALHQLLTGHQGGRGMASLGTTKKLSSMDIVDDVAMAIVHGKVR